MELLIIVIIIAAAVAAEQALYSRFGGMNVKYSCGFEDETINEGDETDFAEIVENRKLLPVPWLKSELTIPAAIEPVNGDSTAAGNDRFITGFFKVKSYSGIKRVRRVKAMKRGVYSVSAARVQTADILGGIRVSISADEKGGTLTVLPVSAHTETVLPERMRRQTGEMLVRNSLVTDPFFTSGVRCYEQGDPMKRIHWNASAHMQELMVRLEEKTARRCILIILNLQTDPEEIGISTADEPLAEHTIRLCVQCIEEAVNEGYSVTLCSCGLTPKGEPLLMNNTSLFSALYALAEISVTEYMPFRQFIKEYSIIPPDTSAVLITPYTDDAAMLWKRQNHDSSVVVSGKGKDYAGIADIILPEPERSDV